MFKLGELQLIYPGHTFLNGPNVLYDVLWKEKKNKNESLLSAACQKFTVDVQEEISATEYVKPTISISVNRLLILAFLI